MNKGKYIRVPVEWLDSLEPLTDEEVGRLFRACLDYAITKELPQLKGNERFVFPTFRRSLQADIDRNTRGSRERHWNWKGGITPENQKGRNSVEHKEWRSAVFARDDYTCTMCGERGGKLNAHHISPWALNKNERYNLDNGTTLCESCHNEVHGRKK